MDFLDDPGAWLPWTLLVLAIVAIVIGLGWVVARMILSRIGVDR